MSEVLRCVAENSIYFNEKTNRRNFCLYEVRMRNKVLNEDLYKE